MTKLTENSLGERETYAASKIAQSDVPNNMLALLSSLRAGTAPVA